MSSGTPRRSLRTPIVHTPKMSERKKGLFQSQNELVKDSLTKHRRLPVLDSESDEDCDLGIISALDGSSCDEMSDQDKSKTPERKCWYETRSHTSRLLNENHNLKNFIKSPFTLKKYQSLCSTAPKGSMSMPVTPHTNMLAHPGTPSSTHSCTSAHTTSSGHSRARKNLASLIADTESCSSSLKDLNFNTDSSDTDTKENTPSKSLRRSTRNKKMTPKFSSFKGILQEQKHNMTSPSFTKNEDSNGVISPSVMLKTPHNPTDGSSSPPKIRRSVIEIAESPEESCDSEISHKRLRNDSFNLDQAPNSKYLKLDPAVAPKARLSLFGSDKLKEILSVKSFYGKSSAELKPKEHDNLSMKLESVLMGSSSHPRRPIVHHYRSHKSRRNRKPGQINMGVRHRIRKPKVHSKGNVVKLTGSQGAKPVPVNRDGLPLCSPNVSFDKNASLTDYSFSQADNDKIDPFSSEKQTVAALLNQWNEEEVPEKEMSYTKPKAELACFSKSAMETNPILPPVEAVPVEVGNMEMGEGSVIMELGGETQGGYIVVDADVQNVNEELPDLDEIEKELQRLDAEILKMAESNNINAKAVIASTENSTIPVLDSESRESNQCSTSEEPVKLFPIFDNPVTGLDKPTKSKGDTEKPIKKSLIKSSTNQYIIDAGQKKFGATQCNECEVIYEIGDPQDEYDHLMYHNATDILKYNGYKEEYVCGWCPDGGRCVRVRGGAAAAWRRVQLLLARLVHPQLGYSTHLPLQDEHYTAYLYIRKKKIVGCLVVEPIAKAHKFIPGDPDCYSDEVYPVYMGVSRVWTHVSVRRQGVASRMLDAARATFLPGHALAHGQVAFSPPTAAGKYFAAKYTGTDTFYVYI